MQLSDHIDLLREFISFHVCIIGMYTLELHLISPSLCARTSVGIVPAGFFDKTFCAITMLRFLP